MLNLSDGSREDERQRYETNPRVKTVWRFDLPRDANVMAEGLLMIPVSAEGICRGKAVDGMQVDWADKDLLLDHDVENTFCGTALAGEL